MKNVFRWFLAFLVAASLALNILVLVVVGSLVAGVFLHWGEESGLRERYHSGRHDAADKVAIIHIDGVILEGLTGYAHKQIEQAAQDRHVKAVVVRINSPGGSITASDDLYHRLRELRDGNPVRQTGPKPLVVSMASLAASGGYYIAMPARHLIAERTTITGSVGVYAAFPNVADLAKTHGVKLDIIKRGDVKASGSMFHEMTAPERQVWQDMVDHAYDQFLAVVREGRGDRLKYPLEAVIPEETKQIPDRDEHGQVKKENNGREVMVEYVRRLADGGIFTADKAQKYGLIDAIGYTEDAVAEARKLAGLGDARVITYDRPVSLLSLALGAQASPPEGQINLGHLANGAAPRLWYLMPQSDLSGFLAASSPQGK